jgi:hypothetical protein
MDKLELETMLQVALDQRKKAYKLRVGSLFISAINHQIRTFQSQLAELEEVAA